MQSLLLRLFLVVHLLFPFLLIFLIHICDIFCGCITVWGFRISLFFSLFSLCFSVWEVSIEISSSSGILSSVTSSLLMNSSGIFHFWYRDFPHWHFFFHSFSVFPSLHLHLLYVVHFYSLESLVYTNHNCSKFSI